MSRRLASLARTWWAAGLLGLATIGGYGTAQYAIGTLIPAIAAETGWPTGLLAGGYSIGALAQGAVALLAGREFDRRGSRYVLLPALLLGCLGYLGASLAGSAWLFVLAWGLGSAAFGGGLYYSVTMPAVSRLYPERRATGLAVLTFLGALAAPIFSPATALLVDAFGWRAAVQWLVLGSAVCVLPAALLVRAPGAAVRAAEAHAPVEGWRQLVAVPAVRRLLLVLALGGMANAALLLHQVGAMQAGGLTLAAASAFAGARGGCQLLGRALLPPITRRFGTRGAMAICYGVAASAAVALLVLAAGRGPVALAAYFAVAGGMSLGLLAPLNGLLQAEVYGDAWLGRLSGLGVVVVSLAGAAGAWGAGFVAQAAGGYAVSAGAIALLQLTAMLLLAAGMRAPAATPRGPRGR